MYGKVVAGFAPIARTMMFHPKMESDNELDQLVVLHECLHIPQMSLRRVSNIELYCRLYSGQGGGKPRIVVEDDYQAYGLQIEGMNLRMDGKLEHEGKQGRQVSHEELLQEFGGRPDQWMMMEMMSRYAKAYFEEGCDAVSNRYGTEYRRQNKRSALHDGYEVYEIDGGGRLQRVFQA